MSDIKASLKLPNANALAGMLTDVGMTTVTIDVPARSLAQLERGSRATLSLTGGELPTAHVSEVHVETFRPEGNRGRVVLRYIDVEDLSRILAKGVGKHFNRRGSFRIEPDKKAPVTVHVSVGDHDTVTAQAIDVSGTGVALAANDIMAGKLPVGAHFSVQVIVPGSLRPLEFESEVRYHRPETSGLQVGLMFDAVRTRGFATTQEHLIDYIMRRQREKLRTRATR